MTNKERLARILGLSESNLNTALSYADLTPSSPKIKSTEEMFGRLADMMVMVNAFKNTTQAIETRAD